MNLLRVFTSYDHGEGVFEAQRLGDFKIESLAIELLYTLVYGRGIAGRPFVKYGIECGAGVLDVKIDLARLHGFVNEQSAAKICFALHVDAGAAFYVLREQLGENDLFSEKFGADYDLRSWRATRGDERYGEDQEKDSAHRRTNFSCAAVKRKAEVF
jgi:hypothetical protein